MSYPPSFGARLQNSHRARSSLVGSRSQRGVVGVRVRLNHCCESWVVDSRWLRVGIPVPENSRERIGEATRRVEGVARPQPLHLAEWPRRFYLPDLELRRIPLQTKPGSVRPN